MTQLTFLPKIDRKATQVRLEEILESVRIYRLFGMIRNEMKVTASSEVRYHGSTNIVGKPAEDIALSNVAMSEREVKLQRLSFQIDKALSRFSKNQRDIIVKGYLEDEEVFDYMVYNEIGMSERTYRRNKSNAFYKLAFALRLGVYETEEQNGRGGSMNFVQPIRDPEQIQQIKEYLNENNERNYILFVMGINTGLRISDILKLKFEFVRLYRSYT